MEKIGQVLLDDTLYPGKDLYTDGAIEDEMLEIARNYREEEWNQVIAERASWPILYHFSHIRENILSWLPFTGEENSRDWIRMRCSYRCSLQESKTGDLY